ncbi:MAG TPA: metal-dependent hydrolase [Burkholderiaceae bacterium]
MPTILTHTAVPLALGIGLGAKCISRRLLAIGVAASMLPDVDVLGFRFNIAYTDTFGHRGVSHSLMFALMVAILASLFAKRLKTNGKNALLFVFVSCASHGLLDAFTNGGEGVALWWPFSNARLFFPWRCIEVSPLNLHRVFSGRGLEVLQSEFLRVWLPAMALCAVLYALRRRYAPPAVSSAG